MKFMIDSSNIEDIKKINGYSITESITTNPSILAKVDLPRHEQLEALSHVVVGDLFVQLVGENAKEMYEDYLYLKEYLTSLNLTYVIKIPLNVDGLIVINRIKTSNPNERILGTTVYSFHQAVLGIHAGCDFLAPYYNRIAKGGEDPNEVLVNIRQYIEDNDYECIIVAASLKNAKQVSDALIYGAHTCTLSPDVIYELLDDKRVEEDFKVFNLAHK